jgi:hypothetical protein
VITFKLIEGGVRKMQSWGYNEVFGADADCFDDAEAVEVIRQLSGLPSAALSVREAALLAALIAKRATA